MLKAKIWFKLGNGDSTINNIKVKLPNACHQDGTETINFLKMIASVATGTSF